MVSRLLCLFKSFIFVSFSLALIKKFDQAQQWLKKPFPWMRQVRTALFVVLSTFAVFAVTAAPADIARGVAWLQTQIQVTGNLVTNSKTATNAQVQCEAAMTLLQVVGSNSQLAALVEALQTADRQNSATESLACLQLLKQRLGQVTNSADLSQRRASDGGFAAYAGYNQSNALDTGWSLETALRNLTSTEQVYLLDWLQSQQSSDGSFSVNGKADVFSTAVVLRGLKEAASSVAVASAIAKKAANYLLSKRDVQAGWLGDVAATALVFEAVHPYSGADGIVSSAVSAYLLSQQLADGSWQADSYVTAVALRALSLATTPAVDPTVAASIVTIQGQAVSGSTNTPIAGVKINVLSGGLQVASALTDVQGSYKMTGLPIGLANISAVLEGYAPVTGVVNLVAKDVVLFSPAMYLLGQTPVTGSRLFGRVVDSKNNNPLQGVTVVVESLGTAPQTLLSGVDGRFDVGVAAGQMSITYSFPGYIGQAQRGVLVDGGTLDAGTIALKEKQTRSSIRGLISDQNGLPVVGATVTVVEQAATSTSNAVGGYQLTDLTGVQWTVRISAPNYVPSSYQINLAEPSDIQQNFTLAKLPVDSVPTTGYVLFTDFSVPIPRANANTEVIATAKLTNPTTDVAATAIGLEVRNALGTVVANLPAYNIQGLPFPPSSFTAGETLSVQYKWNTATHQAGEYTLVAKLIAPNSANTENPNGKVTDSRIQTVTVLDSPQFAGAVTATPPVLRAGSATPIRLSALVQNTGNTILPTQTYQLNIVDSANGRSVHTQSISGEQLLLAKLLPLQFGNWENPVQGSYRIELTSPSVPGSLVTTNLFIGDAASGSFTVDRPIVPTGTQKVRGTIKVSGVDVATGAISDPLAPLVKAAVVKSVNFVDNLVYNHSVSDLKCFACHVQTQAVVGGERNLRFAPPLDPLKRSALMDTITNTILENGSIVHSGSYYQTVNTSLGLWAANAWHEPKAVAMTNRRMGRIQARSARNK